MRKSAILAVVASLCAVAALGVFAFDSSAAAPKAAKAGFGPNAIDPDALRAFVASDITPADRPAPELSPYHRVIERAADSGRTSGLLLLNDRSVDPLNQPTMMIESAFSARPLAPEARRLVAELSLEPLRLVQFEAPITPDTAPLLRRAGLSIVGYIPNNAYLVRGKSDIDNRIAELGGVRYSGPLPIDTRVDAALKSEILNDRLSGPVDLQIAAVRGESMDNWDRLAEALGASELFYKNNEALGRMLIRVPGARVADVVAGFARLPGVENIRRFDLPVYKNHGSIWLLQSGDRDIQSTPLFDSGLTGVGQVYGAVDSGLDTDACQFRYSDAKSAQTMAQTNVYPPNPSISDPDGKVLAYYVLVGSNAYDDSSGLYHGTMTTGCAVGDNYHHLADLDDPGLDRSDGMAPGARIVFQDVGARNGMLAGLFMTTQWDIHSQAYASGVRVHNNSYGLQEPSIGYDQDSQMLDYFMWQNDDYMIFWAAGNDGPSERTLGGEGSTAKNTLVIGASTPGWMGGDDMVSFSSRGPTSDGRLKPDIMAPGIVESAVESEGKAVPGVQNVNGTQAYESTTNPPNNNCHVTMTGGTSFSSPTAAGMGILARQYFTDGYYPSGTRNEDDGFEPSAALIKAVMVNSAFNLTGSVLRTGGGGSSAIGPIDPAPSTHQGWGRITLDDALYLDGDRRNLDVLADVRNGSADTLVTGDQVDYELYVRAGEPLKVTLAWMDPAATSATGRALVNNLDLVVVSPTGVTYRGNINYRASGSQPVAEGSDADVLNPLEQVMIASPEEGLYTVRVVAASVPGNGQTRPHDSAAQGYALIATGALEEEARELKPRIAARLESVGGGCDDDASVDINEVVELNLALTNSGDGLSRPLTATITALEEESDIDLEKVVIPDGGTVQILPMQPHSRRTVTMQVGLKHTVTPIEICNKQIALEVVIADETGSPLESARFSVIAGVDNAEDGATVCQSDVCNPPVDISSVRPSAIRPGESVLKMSMDGNYFRERIAFRFEPDVIEYESVEVSSPLNLEIRNLKVAADAAPGPVTIFATNPTEVEIAFEGLLEIVEREPQTDGDIDGDTDDEFRPGAGAAGGGGCTSGGPSGWLVLALLSGLMLRRKRQKTA